MNVKRIKTGLTLFLLGYCAPIVAGILLFTALNLHALLTAQNSL